MATSEFRPAKPYLVIYAGNQGTSNLMLNDKHPELNAAIDTIVNIIEAHGFEVDLHIKREYPIPDDELDTPPSCQDILKRLGIDDSDERESTPSISNFRNWFQHGIGRLRIWWQAL